MTHHEQRAFQANLLQSSRRGNRRLAAVLQLAHIARRPPRVVDLLLPHGPPHDARRVTSFSPRSALALPSLTTHDVTGPLGELAELKRPLHRSVRALCRAAKGDSVVGVCGRMRAMPLAMPCRAGSCVDCTAAPLRDGVRTAGCVARALASHLCSEL